MPKGRLFILAMLAVAMLGEGPASADEVHSAAGQWVQATPLPEPRSEVSATSDGTQLYLLGGLVAGPAGTAEVASRVWSYQPHDDRWTALTDLPIPVHHAGLVHLNGRLIVVGGFAGGGFEPTDAVQIHDLRTGAWVSGAPLPTPRGALAVVILDGKIHAIGGSVEGGANTGAHEVFDPSTQIWETAADLPGPRNHLGAATVDQQIVVVAGRDDQSAELAETFLYDPVRDTWLEGSPVPTGRSGSVAVELGGWLYLVGGETFDPEATFDDVERYDPVADRWEILPPLPTARHGAGAAAIDGRLHVIAGGPVAGLSFSDAHEVLLPEG